MIMEIKTTESDQTSFTTNNIYIISACPGSGKTTRIHQIVSEKIEEGIDPGSIYAITFTREAARILREKTGLVNSSTIHSLAYSLLETTADINIRGISYTAMLLKATELLKNETIDIDIKLLCIDEAQDLNYHQYEFIEELIKRAEITYMVGDPMQSIYGFQGGSPEYMLHPYATYLQMDKSYRLSSSVCKFINTVFEDQEIYPFQERDSHVKTFFVKNDKPGIYNILYTNLISLSTEDQTTGVLFRTNREVLNFITSVEKGYEYNYVIPITEHPLLALISIYLNYDGYIDLSHIVTVTEYFGYVNYSFRKNLMTLKDLYDSNGQGITMNDLKQVASADLNQNDHISYKGEILNSFSNIIMNVIETLDIYKMDVEYTEESIINAVNNLYDKGLYVERIYDISPEIIAKSLLDNNSGNNSSYRIDNGSNITISTVHAAKGAEYDNVIYTLNTKMSIYDSEEFRIFYVATTRSRNNLYIVSPELDMNEIDHTVSNIYDRLKIINGVI